MKAPKKMTFKDDAPAKPQRVKMINANPANGAIGTTAEPWEKDVPVWELRGWVRA